MNAQKEIEIKFPTHDGYIWLPVKLIKVNRNWILIKSSSGITIEWKGEWRDIENRGEDEEASTSDYTSSIFNRAEAARLKAQRKFPQPNFVTLKVAEEAGEVVRAAVHYSEGRMPWEEVEKETVQAIAMLLRLLVEGDYKNGIHPPQLIRKVDGNG